MTDAEQVACDALRSAGLDELADNLAFAREAVKLRTVLTVALESYCDCGDGGRVGVHDRDCSSVPLLALQPGWDWAEHENAVDAAHNIEMRRRAARLGEWAQRQPGRLFGLDAATWGLNDVVTGTEGEPTQADILARLLR